MSKQEDEKTDAKLVASKLVKLREKQASKWLFGFRMGYMNDPLCRTLPELRDVDDKKLDDNLDDTIKKFAQLIELDGTIRRSLSLAIEEQISKSGDSEPTIKSIVHLLNLLNTMITKSPYWTPKDRHINSAFPMSNIFNPLLYMEYGYMLFVLTEFNDGLRDVLSKWTQYLNSEASCDVLNADVTYDPDDKTKILSAGWFYGEGSSDPDYPYNSLELENFVVDKNAKYWGFDCYNSFFHREIKLDKRPLAGDGDNTIVVSPNDGVVYNVQTDVKLIDDFWVKGQPYSLINMLNNNEHTKRFVGGTVIQSFLSGADYHRWRAPVSGTIKVAEIVNGLMFVELPFTKDIEWPESGDPSQGLEACQNTRGLLMIEADNANIGYVTVIPIGITEISSVAFKKYDANGDVCDLKVGDKVSKGDLVGWFSFGGSSMAMVFEPNALDLTSLPKQNDRVNVRGQIAKSAK